ncbi:hypothetical protein DFH28DRAFT_894648, partial [Melampsora americana]
MQESNDIIRQVVENILDSDDEEECDMTVVLRPWPIFNSKVSYPTIQNFKRKNSSGQITKGYRKPMENPSLKRQKLLPAPVPKQTKHNRLLKQKKALGGNTKMMSNWICSTQKSPTPIQTPNPLTDVVAHTYQTYSDDNSTGSNSKELDPQLSPDFEDQPLDAWIDERVENYRSNHSKSVTLLSSEEKAYEQFDKLNSALKSATDLYTRKRMANPKCSYPSLILDELREFNSRRLELTLSQTKSPSVCASYIASQSSCRRLPPSNLPKFVTGTSRARRIRQQARNLILTGELVLSATGMSSRPASALDDKRVEIAIYQWLLTKKPGEVTPHNFRCHVNETVLPTYEIKSMISERTTYRWMYRMNLRPQEYKKSIYFDGHERPDVVKYRKKYLEDVAELRARSAEFFGDNLEQRQSPDPNTTETIFVYHDESTVHANERPKHAWLLPNTPDLRSKSLGRLIHVSDFILETTGRL